MKVTFFDYLPLWFTYLLFVVIIVFSIYAGIRFSRWRAKKAINEDDTPINTIVGATLGLLAFMLAFTFGLTSSRFEARKLFQLEEMNAIETAWLRADLVNNNYTQVFKKDLVDYLKVRVDIIEDPSQVLVQLERANKIQNKIWNQITQLSKAGPENARINALFIDSINDMFDYQSRRVAKGINDRIPPLIWLGLFALILIAMFEVGYLLGKMKKINWIMILALSMAFSAVIYIIVDLDSTEGNIVINSEPVIELYQKLSK